jgi:hypothetical protein
MWGKITASGTEISLMNPKPVSSSQLSSLALDDELVSKLSFAASRNQNWNFPRPKIVIPIMQKRERPNDG